MGITNPETLTVDVAETEKLRDAARSAAASV